MAFGACLASVQVLPLPGDLTTDRLTESKSSAGLSREIQVNLGYCNGMISGVLTTVFCSQFCNLLSSVHAGICRDWQLRASAAAGNCWEPGVGTRTATFLKWRTKRE